MFFKWLRSEVDAIPLALVMLSSPQLPLTTLEEIQKKGFYTYLPNFETLLRDSDRTLEGYSERMKRVLEAAIAVQRSGSREALEDKMRDVITELRTTLELSDLNISNLYTLVSTFLSTMSSMIVATLALVGTGASTVAIGMALAATLLSALVGAAIYPLEFSLSTPPWKSYSPLLLFPLVYLALTYFRVPLPITLSLSVASIFPAIVHLYYTKREIEKIKMTREMVRVAARSVGNPYQALVRQGFIREPEDLLSREESIATAARLGLYQILLHGGYEFLEKLNEYFSNIVDFIFRLRSKTRVFLLYAVLETVIVSAIYGFLVAMLPLFSEGGEVLRQAGMSAAGILELEQNMDFILASTALALSIATSSAREGKPTFFTMYLPLIGFSLFASYLLTLTLAPGLFR